jgi:RimJ/RimL family protein N-acetyltransferase
MSGPHVGVAFDLYTRRLLLRRLQLSDAAAIFDIFADEQVARYQDVEPFTRREQARGWLERAAQRQASGEALRWGVTLRDTGQLIGTCGYVAFAGRHARGTLGYEIARAHWGQGLMPEALAAAIRHGFERLSLHRIDAFVAPNNARSARVLQKLGFTNEGVLRDYGLWKGRFWDLCLYSLLRSDEPKWAEL